VVCQKAPLGAKATLNSRKIKPVALCVPFLFESIKLVVIFDGFLLSLKYSVFFHSVYLDYRGAFQRVDLWVENKV